MQRHGHEALDADKEFIGSVPSSIVPLRPINILGLGGLRVLLYGDRESALPTKTGSDWTPPAMESLEALVADIEPLAWVINQSLLSSGSCDPLLQRCEAAEHRYLREMVEMHSTRTAWLPWQPEEPVGPDALARLAPPLCTRPCHDRAFCQNSLWHGIARKSITDFLGRGLVRDNQLVLASENRI